MQLTYFLLHYSFYYIHFEIAGDPCTLIGSHECNLIAFPRVTQFLLEIASFLQPMGKFYFNTTTNHISRLVLRNQSKCRKITDSFKFSTIYKPA